MYADDDDDDDEITAWRDRVLLTGGHIDTSAGPVLLRRVCGTEATSGQHAACCVSTSSRRCQLPAPGGSEHRHVLRARKTASIPAQTHPRCSIIILNKDITYMDRDLRKKAY